MSMTIVSRIIKGNNYIAATKDIAKKGFLIAPPLDLAPAHVDCARIVFTDEVGHSLFISNIYDICRLWSVDVCPDSVVYYGTQGTPIV